MIVSVADARALFLVLGFKAAGKWSADKLGSKIDEIQELTEDLNLDEIKGEHADEYKTLKAILAAQKKNKEVTVEGGEEEAEEEAPKKKKGKAAAKEDGEDETVPVKEKAAKKEKKEKKEPAPKKEGPDGVRESRSRPYLAGIIIREHSKGADPDSLLKTGVTDAMVEALDEAYGKPNPSESKFCLRNAWHAIRGANTEGNKGDLKKAAE